MTPVHIPTMFLGSGVGLQLIVSEAVKFPGSKNVVVIGIFSVIIGLCIERVYRSWKPTKSSDLFNAFTVLMGIGGASMVEASLGFLENVGLLPSSPSGALLIVSLFVGAYTGLRWRESVPVWASR